MEGNIGHPAHVDDAVEQQDVAEAHAADGMDVDRDAYPPNAEAAALRRGRNTSLPISQIPEEIMLEIFSYLPACKPKLKRNAPLLDVVRISHVCSHWRGIAIAYPYLWSHLYCFKNKDCVEAFLERSGAIPLSVCYNRIPGEDDRCWFNFRHALRHMARIRELELSGAIDFIRWDPTIDISDRGTSWQSIPRFKDDLHRAAPLLERFHIDAFHESRGIFGNEMLPANLFANHAPALRSFYARGTSVPWSSLSFMRHLTEFHVCANDNYYWTTHPRVLVLLNALRQCRQLEQLTLDGLSLLDSRNEVVDQAQAPVQLPSLRKFRMKTRDLPSGALFLNNVRMNDNVEWEVEVLCDADSIDDVPPGTMIIPRFQGGEAVRYEHLAIEIDKATVSFRLAKAAAAGLGAGGSLRIRLINRRRHVDVDAENTGTEPAPEPDDLIFATIRTVVQHNTAWTTFEDVRVKLAFPRMIPRACWAGFFALFPGVMEFAYDVPRSSRFDFSEGLLECLMEYNSETGVGVGIGSEHCRAYSLYNLTLAHPNFYRDQSDPTAFASPTQTQNQPQPQTHPTPNLYTHLLAFLRMRWACGRPITEMHIAHAYGLTSYKAVQIEALVDLVEWDGLEIGRGYFVEDFPEFGVGVGKGGRGRGRGGEEEEVEDEDDEVEDEVEEEEDVVPPPSPPLPPTPETPPYAELGD